MDHNQQNKVVIGKIFCRDDIKNLKFAIQVTNYCSSETAIEDKQTEGLFVKIGQTVQKLWTFENWKKC